MKRLLPLILILVGVCSNVHAQKGLAIGSAFDELAVKKNVTEVVMGAGRLKKYNLSLFHSLEIKNPTADELQRIETLLRTDAEQAILHEENASHELYELPSRKGMHHYIFYRRTSQSLILIYIEGKANLKQIKEKFLKK
jgi:hypothetical protein